MGHALDRRSGPAFPGKPDEALDPCRLALVTWRYAMHRECRRRRLARGEENGKKRQAPGHRPIAALAQVAEMTLLRESNLTTSSFESFGTPVVLAPTQRSRGAREAAISCAPSWAEAGCPTKEASIADWTHFDPGGT